jgi:hypothetical protein
MILMENFRKKEEKNFDNEKQIAHTLQQKMTRKSSLNLILITKKEKL